MNSRLFWPWRFEGTVGSKAYFLAGILLFLFKWTLDTVVATIVFGRDWSPANYLIHGQIPLAVEARGDSGPFLGTMLSLSVPFIAAGLALTVRRLRALALPMWMVVLFFPPIINLIFFVILCVLGTSAITLKPQNLITPQPLLVPRPAWKSATIAGLITAALGTPLTIFTIYGLGVYGAGLFVGLPFCLGIIAAQLHGYSHPRTCKECLKAAVFGIIFLFLMFFIGHLEGLLCLVMAAPLVMGCALIGAVVGYYIQQQTRNERETALLVIALVLTVPALMGAETSLAGNAPQYAVRTKITIDRAPKSVWDFVVRFPPLPPPEEWLFQSGIAYPMGATIAGSGPGAERRCVFSSGSFIEPIEVWDEPRLLKFSVTSNPPPMQEWTIFAEVHPPHLEGFMVSRAGQFLLSDLPDGRTSLEGTTWYEHNLWPSAYWRLWSDAIIHRIHLRVLKHVKQLAENECRSPA